MSKIKWSWKLRIKKNTKNIDYLEGVVKDLKDRVENIELKQLKELLKEVK